MASSRATAPAPDRLLNIREVAALISYSPHSIARKMKEPDFPKAVRLSGHRIAWYESEIHEYIRTRPRA
jgi:predicted DNA-binding transcriptional regulator AlpA